MLRLAAILESDQEYFFKMLGTIALTLSHLSINPLNLFSNNTSTEAFLDHLSHVTALL